MQLWEGPVHSVRENTDMCVTPKTKRQDVGLLESAHISVFFLDENQYVRLDEIGNTDARC